MIIKVKYNNVEAEFEAYNQQDIYDAEKLFKCAAYAFREDEVKQTMAIYDIHNARNGHGLIAVPRRSDKPIVRTAPVPNNPNGPATEKQLACLRGRHIKYDQNITKAEAFELIKNSNPR